MRDLQLGGGRRRGGLAGARGAGAAGSTLGGHRLARCVGRCVDLHGLLAPHLVDRLVDAHAAEAGVADVAIGRPLAEGDLHDDAGRHPVPGGTAALGPPARLHGLRVDRRRLGDEPRQALHQLARGGVAPAGAHRTGVVQATLVVVAEQQVADLGGGAALVGEADDNELLPLLALELQPGLGARTDVGRVGLLQQHAFEPHVAGGGEQLLGRHVEGLAEAHGVDGLLRQHALQHGAAAGQRHGAQVGVAEEGDVEHEVDDVLAARLVHRVLQQVEAGHALVVEHDDLAVQVAGVEADGFDGGGQVRELRRPVVAVAGDQPGLAARDAGQHAVAVVLVLDDPGAHRRRGADQRGELRLSGAQAAWPSRRWTGRARRRMRAWRCGWTWVRATRGLPAGPAAGR